MTQTPRYPQAHLTELIERCEADALSGESLSFDDALALAEAPAEIVPAIIDAADRIRARFCGNSVDLCAIVSARTGGCSEDCSFCVQSRNANAHLEITPMMPPTAILETARKAAEQGAHRFCIVTSGKALSDADFESVLEALALIGAEIGVARCASLGLLTAQRARSLAEAGLTRYHHNLETCRSFFSTLCTTHSYDDRVATVRAVRSAGLQVCCGGILNVGETLRQRVELAFELAGLAPDSVPVNFLDPRPGTALEDRPPIGSLEAAHYVALLRFVMPTTSIRLAGGRRTTFGCEPGLALRGGASAMLIGDLLTTSGPDAAADIAMVRSIGLDPG